jgi:hypothetical protein
MDEGLRARFRLDSWRGVNRLDGSLLLRRVTPAALVGPGWVLVRGTPIPGDPPSYSSIWRPKDGPAGALLRLDLYESRSRGSAHERLVSVLGHFQSHEIEQAGDAGVGDVAFAPAGRRSLVIARANLVLHAASVGSTPIDVVALLSSIDEELIAKPAPIETASAAELAPRMRAVATPLRAMLPAGGVARRMTARAREHAPLPPMQPVLPGGYLKYFSTAGELSAVDDEVMLTPHSPGEGEVDVYGRSPDGHWSHSRVAVDVE